MRRRCAATVRSSRLSSITAAIGVAIIAAVGALGVYVGKALPGHHAASTSGTSTPRAQRGRRRATAGQRSGQQRPGSTQPAVHADAGGLAPRAGHQRIELMAQACVHAGTQRVFRTRALGTIAELVVSDGARTRRGIGAARARARANRPRRQQVPE